MQSLLAISLAALLTGCASLLPRIERVPSSTLVAAPDAPLATAARDANIPPGESGVWPLLQGSYALDSACG